MVRDPYVCQWCESPLELRGPFLDHPPHMRGRCPGPDLAAVFGADTPTAPLGNDPGDRQDSET